MAKTITELLGQMKTFSTPQERSEVERQLVELVYPTLKKKAEIALRKEFQQPHTLSTESLLSELYIELFHKTEISWTDSNHFFNLASKKINDILVQNARHRLREKRGGGALHLSVAVGEELTADSNRREGHLSIVVGDIMERLQKEKHPDTAILSVIELHYFGGFTLPEAAEMIGISLRNAENKWRKFKDMVFEYDIKDKLQSSLPELAKAAKA